MSTYFEYGNLIEGVNSTVSSGGTLALIASSKTMQRITGTQDHTVTLPDATTLKNAGRRFSIKNRSTGTVTVKDFAGTTVGTLTANTQRDFVVSDVSSSAGIWQLAGDSGSSGGGSGSVQAADTIKMLQGLSLLNYNDGNIASKRVKFNPEETGANVWLSRGTLNTGQYRNAAFNISGYAYNAGGQSSVVVERYDDDNNYWVSRASLASANSGDLPATFDISGFGYNAGGNYVNTVVKYTDSTNSWAAVTSLPIVLGQTTGYALNGYGYTHSGSSPSNGTNTTAIYRYDDVANTWAIRGPVITARDDGKAVALNGFGIAFGGRDATITDTLLAEKFNDSSNVVTAIRSASASHIHGGGFSILGHAYLASHNSGALTVERYSDIANSWTTVAPSIVDQNGNKGFSLNEFGYQAGTGGTGTAVYRYSASNYMYLGSFLKSNTLPAALLLAAGLKVFNNVVPAQIRTDGDSWKTVSANLDSALKFNETIKSKFKEYTLGYVAAGTPDLSTALSTNQFYNPSANTWTSRQALTTARQSSSSFTINAHGMIFSGVNTGSAAFISSGEKYDDILNAWSSVTNITTDITFGAGYSIEGYGFVAGGSTAVSGSTANNTTNHYRYDPVANTWSSKAVLPSARSQHGATSHEGRGYVTGGTTGSAQTTNYQYDATLDSWATKTALSAARFGNNGSSLGSFGYSIAGHNGGSPVNNAEKYNTVTNAWSTTSATNAAHQSGCSFRVGGNVYVAGGVTSTAAEKYNDGSDTWTSITSLNTATYGGCTTNSGAYRDYEVRIALPNALISTGAGFWVTTPDISVSTQQCGALALNDFGYRIGGTANLASSDKYNASSNTWVAGPQLNSGIQSFQCGSVQGFGYTVKHTAATNEKLDDTLNVWTASVASDPINVGGHAVVGVLNGLMYAMGGATTDAVRYYNPQTNAWTSGLAVLSSSRYYAISFSADGFMYIVGEQNSPYSVVQRYNDAANTWAAMANTINGHGGPTQFVLGQAPYVHGGGAVSGNTALEKYNTGVNVWLDRTFSINSRCLGGGFSLENSGFVFGGSPGGSTSERFVSSINDIILGVGLEAK